MKNEKLHIYEEATYLFWGLIVVVSTTLATYILANSFFTEGWAISGLNQILVLLLFTLSFSGIFKLSEPLLHFVFEADRQEVIIHIHKGEEKVAERQIDMDRIAMLRFEPYTPREKGEALFDFSTNYRLMWKAPEDSRYRPLIELEDISFTLKVEDIAKIIRFLLSYNPEIEVPPQQEILFDL